MFTLLLQAKSTLQVFGPVELVSRTKNYVSFRLFGVEAYQRPLTKCLKRLSENHQSFIDVGAAGGDIVHVVEPSFKKVVAVEPAPHHLVQLRRRKQDKELGKAVVLGVAVSDHSGKAKLGLSPTNPDDNSLFNRQDLEKYVEVEQKTLDAIIAEQKLPQPIAIKMDIQGFEGHVFAGAKKTLKDGASFIIEFWPWGLSRANTDPMEMIKKLTKQGYEVKALDGHEYSMKKLKKLSELGAQNKTLVDDILLTPSSDKKSKR